ncbi:Group 2 truncated hemoglobin YjbI [Paenibacillus solanacearum]|uniref:Group 2 truncated hemoglobin YjbI n=1 Tax=Paenibacillus solanacearum TaxID=2048548 RepID=A0A916K3W9_9BACL|nr:globin [Paenibacillus solanacearum]CAG7640911.1 Group 2 truncated hemoglobin YjbI [Paenibacillus solanacearum]
MSASDESRERTVYEAMGGAEGIRTLVEAFYPKVQQHPLLGPLFPDDIVPVMEKQKMFLTQFFGGPPLYSEQHGHPMMRARHMAFPVTAERAEAWLDCMRRALEETEMAPELQKAVLERLKGPAYHFINS